MGHRAISIVHGAWGMAEKGNRENAKLIPGFPDVQIAWLPEHLTV